MDNTSFDESNSRSKLLEILIANTGKIVPSTLIIEKLHSSRQAISKLIKSLKDEGILIEAIPQKGYLLSKAEEAEQLSPTLINYFLRQNPIFHTSFYFKEVDSTQSVIKKLAQQNAPDGIVAIADIQNCGRGRRGRTWSNASGKNLIFSVLLRPRLRPGEVQLLNLAAGLAVRKVLSEYYNLNAELKWPNDILINNKKICGILSEAAVEPDKIYYAITGIGLNVNMKNEDIPEEISDKATSMFIESSVENKRPLLLIRILDVFANLLKQMEEKDGLLKLLTQYRTYCATIGRDVRIIQDEEEFCGRAVDVTDQGALIVRINENNVIFAAADVHHLRLK